MIVYSGFFLSINPFSRKFPIWLRIYFTTIVILFATILFPMLLALTGFGPTIYGSPYVEYFLVLIIALPILAFFGGLEMKEYLYDQDFEATRAKTKLWLTTSMISGCLLILFPFLYYFAGLQSVGLLNLIGFEIVSGSCLVLSISNLTKHSKESVRLGIVQPKKN